MKDMSQNQLTEDKPNKASVMRSSKDEIRRLTQEQRSVDPAWGEEMWYRG